MFPSQLHEPRPALFGADIRKLIIATVAIITVVAMQSVLAFGSFSAPLLRVASSFVQRLAVNWSGNRGTCHYMGAGRLDSRSKNAES